MEGPSLIREAFGSFLNTNSRLGECKVFNNSHISRSSIHMVTIQFTDALRTWNHWIGLVCVFIICNLTLPNIYIGYGYKHSCEEVIVEMEIEWKFMFSNRSIFIWITDRDINDGITLSSSSSRRLNAWWNPQCACSSSHGALQDRSDTRHLLA